MAHLVLFFFPHWLEGDNGAVLGCAAPWHLFHWNDSIILVIMLILPQAAVPVNIVFMSGLSFVHFQRVL